MVVRVHPSPQNQVITNAAMQVTPTRNMRGERRPSLTTVYSFIGQDMALSMLGEGFDSLIDRKLEFMAMYVERWGTPLTTPSEYKSRCHLQGILVYYSGVVQRLEHHPVTVGVGGSSPLVTAKLELIHYSLSRLVQIHIFIDVVSERVSKTNIVVVKRMGV